MHSNQTYFANLTAGELSAALMERVRAWRDYLSDTGKAQQIRDSYCMRYGYDRDTEGWTTRRVWSNGQGNIKKLQINHLASLERGVITILTGQMPSMEPKAKNTDSASTAQANLATGVLEEWLHDKGGLLKLKRQAEHAFRYSGGWLSVTWNPNLGDEVAVDNLIEQPLVLDPESSDFTPMPKAGEVEATNFTPFDVFLDAQRPDGDGAWVITRTAVNRYDAAVEHQEYAEKILNVAVETELEELRLGGLWRSMKYRGMLNDIIYRYDFWHGKTPSVPAGKHVVFFGEDCCVLEEQLQYPEVPVYFLAPERQDDSPEGHTPYFDMQGPQQALNALASQGLSKSNMGNPITFIPRRANIGRKDLGTPFALLEYDGDKEPSNFVPSVSPAEDYNALTLMQKQMETISGVNSVMRGNPESSLKSGAALALVQAQAAISQTSFQQNFHLNLEKVGNAVLTCHKLFNQSKRALKRIAGSKQQYQVGAFDGSMLQDVESVTVRAGNPLKDTIGGRQALIETLSGLGAPLDTDRVVSFWMTGEWRNVVEDGANEEQFIRQENEAMGRGELIPPGSPGEDHFKHILGHVPRTIEEKYDADVHANKLEHIASHVALIQWMAIPPEMVAKLASLGFAPPLPPEPMMPPDASSTGAPMPGATSGTNPAQKSSPAQAGGAGEAGMPSLPSMPDGSDVDPLTAQAAASQGVGQ